MFWPMFWFVTGIVFILAGIGVLLIRRRFASPPANSDAAIRRNFDDERDAALARRGLIIMALVLIGLGAFIVVWDSFTVVPARNVSIVNTFGKAEGTLDNGGHWVKPWSGVETIDATVQNINLSADAHNCITVRLANQTTACVDVTTQWNIDQHANANELWQRYRGSNDDVVGNVGANVVQRELRRSLNVVFETYNPLAVLSGAAPGVSTDDLANHALAEIRSHVDPGIVIDTMRISLVHYDDTTQGKLNGYAQALADTQIATQQRKTAEQQRLANDELAAVSSSNDGVRYQNCLNLLKDLAAKGQLQNLPPTFNCGGSTTPVIVGGTK